MLQVAWALLVARLSESRVVTFGETVSGRPADLPGVENMVGLFINTLPVVVDVDPDATLAAVASALQDDKTAVLDHQHLGLPEIIANSGVPIAFGVLTTDSTEQALERAGLKHGNKGWDAALTALEMLNLFSVIDGGNTK